MQNSEWKRQVADFVTQCFETFPKYGEDTLVSKIKTFTVGLEDYSIDEVSYGFREWLKHGKKMPVPADIGDEAMAYRKNTANQHAPKHAKPLPRQQANRVPWFSMSWKQIQEEGLLSKVEAHLVYLSEVKGSKRAEGYLHYLKTGPQNQYSKPSGV